MGMDLQNVPMFQRGLGGVDSNLYQKENDSLKLLLSGGKHSSEYEGEWQKGQEDQRAESKPEKSKMDCWSGPDVGRPDDRFQRDCRSQRNNEKICRQDRADLGDQHSIMFESIETCCLSM
jgi:hypothetical protein